ncbi:MAG: NB-ARC domain-containing protein [Cyanobacteria bacterium P01_H01_bin.152]
MPPSEILKMADELLFAASGQYLTDIQKLILSKSLEKKKYSDIKGYNVQHLKNEGAKLWRSLSEALNENITKSNFRAALERYGQRSDLSKYDWGEAPDVPVFFGRVEALTTLRHWILEDSCRLVVVTGMAGMGKTGLSIKLGKGGVGKTDLTVKLAHGIQGEFDYVIWRRLLNAPSLSEIIEDCLKVLSNQKNTHLPEAIEAQITALLSYLKKHRCLLVFDNTETILEGGSRHNKYIEGYEAYEQFFQAIASIPHQSCLLLTSREIPSDLEKWEGKNKPVRFYGLRGLSVLEGKKIFAAIDDFVGADEAWTRLIELYDGNPLALELAAHHIKTVFGRQIAHFFRDGNPIFHNLRELLDWHVERLSEPEKAILYWFAINREPVSVAELSQDVVATWQQQLPDIFQALRKKLPLEESEDGTHFTLQPVLIEYMTAKLIEQSCQEIETGQIERLNSHALLKAQAKEYVRESQARLILTPIITQLTHQLASRDGLEDRLKQILSEARKHHPCRPGYLAGNLLNLLCQLGTDLAGYDFSSLMVRQAYLQGQTLHNTNFAGADLSQSVFMKAFGGIHAVNFSADGQCLALGDSHGKVRLLRIQDDQQVAVSQGLHHWIVVSIVLSPDGQRLVSSGADDQVILWRLPDLQCLKVLKGHTDWVWAIAFSPDGNLIASGSDDTTIRLWQGHTGELISVLTGHEAWVEAVVFSPDGKLLASGGKDDTIRLWNLETEQCIETLLTEHHGGVWGLDFNPDGTLLASCDWGTAEGATIKLWDMGTRQCIQTLVGHKNPIKFVFFSQDGRFLVSNEGITQSHEALKPVIKLWNVATGKCVKNFQGHTTGIRSLALSPDNRLIASGDIGQVVKLWDVATGKCLKTLRGNASWVSSLVFSADDRTLASANLDTTVKMWDVATGACLHSFADHSAWVWAVRYSPDGRFLFSSGDDETIRVWQADPHAVQPRQAVMSFSGQQRGGFWAIACSPDSQYIAAVGQSSTVSLWEVSQENCIKTLGDHFPYWIWDVQFSPDGRWIATASDDKTVKLWEIETGHCLQTFQGHTHKLKSVHFSSDGQHLISGGEDSVVRYWDVQTGECLRIFKGHQDYLWKVRFSPDGQLIASASSDHTVKLWDVSTGTCITTLEGHTDQAYSIAFSHTGQRLASGSMDGTIKLWDLNTYECLNTLREPRPYEGMNITRVKGLTESQKLALASLGAVEDRGHMSSTAS